MEVGGDHPDMRTLQAFSTLIHDAHTLFSAQPSAARYSFLRALLSAAFAAPAASQAGLGTYLLLGPATDALWELQLLARGDSECAVRMAAFEEELTLRVGHALWERLAEGAQGDSGGGASRAFDAGAPVLGVYSGWRCGMIARPGAALPVAACLARRRVGSGVQLDKQLERHVKRKQARHGPFCLSC